MALFITFLLGFFFLLGALIIKVSDHKELVEHLSLAMAFGAMIALAAFDLIPEIMESYNIQSFWIALIGVVLGVAMLKILDHFIPEHNESDEEESEENLVHIGLIAAVAIVLHNIVEGMTVYSMALSSVNTGFSLAVGVGLHNIPMGMLIYSTLMKERKSKKYLVFLASGSSTFIGGLLMMCISGLLTSQLISFLICIALGMVVYIVVFELYPSVRHAHDKKLAYLGVLIGLAVVFASMFME